MNIIKLNPGDRLQMKKKHPGSSDIFKVIRTGSDVRIQCEGCARDLTITRDSIEKMIKKVITSTNND